MKYNPFIGTETLLCFIFRRDRLRLAVWIASITFIFVLFAISYPEVLPTDADREARALMIQNPAAVALTGPGYGIEDYTYGAMIANELGFLTALAIALMSISMVIRHTRAEEESGRAELVRAAVVGRYATLTATLAAVVIVNLVLGAAIGAGLVLAMDLCPVGSFTLGGWLAMLGIVFAGLTAVFAQLTEHTRGASGMAYIALGLTSVFRAMGDVGDGTLSWLSPFGWGQATRPFVDERYWPLAISLGFATLLIAVAYCLCSRRDVGAGMVRSKPGRAHASNLLSWPAGLAVRLQRGSIIGWIISLAFMGMVIGAMGQEGMDFVAETPQMQEIFGADAGAALVDAVFATFIRMFCMVIAGFGAQVMLGSWTEESSGRAESVLGTAVSRWRWAGSYLAVGLAASTIALILIGLTTALTYSAIVGDTGDMPRILGAFLAYLPAVWMLACLATAILGLVPRLGSLAWVVVIYGIVVEIMGPLLDFPAWTEKLSLFHYVPGLPAAEFSATPLVVMTAIAMVLAAVGLMAFRSRDLQL